MKTHTSLDLGSLRLPPFGLCILLLLGNAPGDLRANLLENPGFEDGLTGWQAGPGAAFYESDSTMPRSGSFAAKGVDDEPGSLGRLFQDVTSIVIPGEQYRVQGWIKTTDVTSPAAGFGASIVLGYVDSVGATTAAGDVVILGNVSGTTDWSFFDSGLFSLPVMPLGTESLHFLFDHRFSEGTAFYDDVALLGPRSEEIPEPSTLLLVGGALAIAFRLRRAKG